MRCVAPVFIRHAFIAKADWPASSPDLNPMDYYVWGVMQRAVEEQAPSKESELKVAIRKAARNIPLLTLQKAIDGFYKRCHLAVQCGGMPFKHRMDVKGIHNGPARTGEVAAGEDAVLNFPIAQHAAGNSPEDGHIGAPNDWDSDASDMDLE